jgi:hypothetical protein
MEPYALVAARTIARGQEGVSYVVGFGSGRIRRILIDGKLANANQEAENLIRIMRLFQGDAYAAVPYVVACLMSPTAAAATKEAALNFLMMATVEGFAIPLFLEMVGALPDPVLKEWASRTREGLETSDNDNDTEETQS